MNSFRENKFGRIRGENDKIYHVEGIMNGTCNSLLHISEIDHCL